MSERVCLTERSILTSHRKKRRSRKRKFSTASRRCHQPIKFKSPQTLICSSFPKIVNKVETPDVNITVPTPDVNITVPTPDVNVTVPTPEVINNISTSTDFPALSVRLQPLLGQTISVFVGILSSSGTLTEVNSEYIVIVDATGVTDIFPLNTISAVEF